MKDGDVYVEVGSWLGKSAALMGVEIINSGKQVTLTCIDPWIDGGPDLRDSKHFRKHKEPIYEIFKRNVAPVASVIKVMKMTSVEAAAHFADASVDFIMLDGDHSYEAVRADIAAWLPKMKPGSVMSGDDYLWPGVKRAAHEAFGDRVMPLIRKETENYRMSVACWSVQL